MQHDEYYRMVFCLSGSDAVQISYDQEIFETKDIPEKK